MLLAMPLCTLSLLVPTTRMEVDVKGLSSSTAQKWTIAGPSDRSEVMELSFAIRQQNLDKLEETLLEVSDPSNAERYGKWLSQSETHDLVAPLKSDIENVVQFLVDGGVSESDITMATPNGDVINAVVSISVAEQLLNAEYDHFLHRSGQSVHRCTRTGYSLPARVAASVDFVAPTIRLPNIRASKQQKHNSTTPKEFLNNPKTLKELYNVDAVTGSLKSGNKMAVTAFLEQYYQPASLQEFYNMFCAKATPNPVTCGMSNKVSVVTKGDAGAHPGSGTESMLDIEYITALGANIPSEFWGFSGRSPDNKNNEPFMKWLTLVGNTSDADVPKLFSSSYGEDEDTVSDAWAVRLNVEFEKVGVRGISVLFASGDSGAAGDAGCPDGVFVPQWPSASPWVTAVGGTAPGVHDSAAGLSSGGFSNRWARPSWQTAAVAKYKSSAKLPNASKWNQTGRGFPDISAQAENFVVVSNRIPLPGVAGTSCAAPTASGVVSLLNDLRLDAKKPALGYLNPFIYQNMDSWNDITTGANGGCGFSAGFPAVAGWDACTGVGTPNYSKLSKVVVALP